MKQMVRIKHLEKENEKLRHMLFWDASIDQCKGCFRYSKKHEDLEKFLCCVCNTNTCKYCDPRPEIDTRAWCDNLKCYVEFHKDCAPKNGKCPGCGQEIE